MDSTLSGVQHIKEENVDINSIMLSSRILSSRLYDIHELCPRTTALSYNENYCMPKEVILQKNEGLLNPPEYAPEDGANYYELLVLRKDDTRKPSNNIPATVMETDNKEQKFHDFVLVGKEEIQTQNINVLSPVAQEGLQAGDTCAADGNIILLCPFCGNEFETTRMWREHLNDIHEFQKREYLNIELGSRNEAKCHQCSAIIKGSNIGKWQQHRISHLLYKDYFKCKFCHIHYSCKKEIINHLKCKHAGSSTIKVNDINNKNHKRSHNDNLLLLCPFCGSEFKDSICWRQHLNETHEFHKRETVNMEFLPGNKAKCKQCNLTLNGTHFGRLKDHKILHLPYKRYFKCKLCIKLFGRSTEFVNHLALCGSTSSTLSERHNTIKPVQSHVSVLNSERATTTSTPYNEYVVLLCPFCGAEYQDQGQWRQHLNSEHEFHKIDSLNMELISGNKAKCKQCSATLSAGHFGRLKDHKILHLPYKRYFKCKICEQLFQRRCQIISHLERKCYSALQQKRASSIIQNC